MTLRQRVVIPFVSLFALTYSLTVAVSIWLATSSVEQRLVEPARNLAGLLSNVPWTTSMLGHLKTAFGADVALVEGGTVHSTIDGLTLPPLPVAGIVPLPGHLAVVEPVGARRLVMLYPPDHLSSEQWRVARPLMLFGLAGLIAVVLIGYAIARSIAKPLESVAAQTASQQQLTDPAGGPELARVVDAFNRMLDGARRTERLAAMGAMAAGVAHEIRNPLAAMKMTAQMLAMESKDPEPFNLLLREIERLDLIAGEFSTKDVPLAKQPVALDALVADVLELVRRQLDHLGVKVERRLESVQSAVDVNRIKRVVWNLVLNGSQAMPKGGALTVGVARRDGAARITVADTGPGIPAALRDRLFEPFATGRADGVGLGLALTRKIVEDHGGRIGFDSSEKGTTFWIELPIG